MTHRHIIYNPFGQPPDAQRAELAVVHAAELVTFLRSPKKRAIEVVGQSGRGKTTLMRVVREALDDDRPQRWWKLERTTRWQRPNITPIMWIDEAQRMSWWQRAMVFQQAQTLMLTTHRSLERSLRRAGFEYQQVHVRGLTPEVLGEIIARRIEWSGRQLDVTPQVIDALLEHYGDDLRAIFDMLYEMVRVMSDAQVSLRWPPDVPWAPRTPPYA